MDSFFDDAPFARDFFADKPSGGDVYPRYWHSTDFSRHRQATYRWGQPGKKRRLRHSAADMNLAHEILSDLGRYGAHASDWTPITEEEALYDLRADDWTRIYRETRRGWEPLNELNGRPSGERVLAFRRPRPQDSATYLRQPRTPPIRLTPDARLGCEVRREPLVYILHPINDAVIEPETAALCHRQLEWVEFQPGDTAESVTRRYLGYPAPQRVYNEGMHIEPGKSYRVFTGYLLSLEGGVANAARIKLAWNGPTEGRRTLAGSAAGSDYWSTEIPVKPGHYQIIARLDEGPEARVDFEVVENEGNLMQRTLGMAKELVNRVVAENRALANEWFAGEGIFRYTDQATGEALPPAAVAERYRNDSAPLLDLEGPGEAAGAETLRELPQTPALVGVITALGSHGKSLLRHPEAFLDDLKRALTHSRGETEALGELGMHQAKRRLGIETDPRYVNRYHGPDEIGRDTRQDGLMTEWETKAGPNDRVRVAEDKQRNRQGSKEKNRLRAEAMKKKEQQGKVGQPSNRQGGPYQEGEMEMWGEIERKRGNKQHLLVHTNTETGVVRTFEQINGGKIGKKLDEFKLENFEEAKAMIEEHFMKLKEVRK